MAPPPRARPYKDFMTPLLHRRFARATSYLAILCYVESLYIGGLHSWFWSWFPIGRAGIRAALLFIPAFMIFVLRVSQLHVGLRTSKSAWDTFRTFPKFQIAQTLVWYLVSALLFSEVYLWSISNAELGRIKYMAKTERPTLNEKPIYLTSYLLILAVLQASFHLYFDYDKINIGVTKAPGQVSSTQDSHQAAHPAERLFAAGLSLVLVSVRRAAALTILGPLIYLFPLYPFSIRKLAWGVTRSWAKLFYTLPKSGALPPIKPFHYTVLWSTFSSGFMLVFLWELGNAAFSIYVAQAPLKNERPITYESRDPNGSLLTGLRGKKVQTRAFAFWELVLIAQRFEGRRKAIYEDIDRQGGSTWSQILAVSLDEIGGIEKRISAFQRPAVSEVEPTLLPPRDDVRLPRLTQPLSSGIQSSDDLFTAPRSRTSGFETNILTRNKASSNALSPKAKALISKAEDSVFTQEQKATKSAEGVIGLFRGNIVSVLRYSIGKPFRQEYRRTVAAVVLGQPYGDVGVIVDAVDSLTRFAVCSLNEDKYGNVQRDVKTIIQSFTNTIHLLDGFKASVKSHWTDVEGVRESPEVEKILIALRGGLKELVEAFGDYSEDLRLSQSEIRMAREAITDRSNNGREMQQTS